MDAASYDIWANRINQAVRTGGERERPPRPQTTLKARLLAFAAEASAIVGAIVRNVDAVDILGADRHDTLEGFLDRMLEFEDFVFLEYRYKTGDREEPGLRFKVEQGDWGARIAVHYFRDLVFWDVDEAGQRVFLPTIRFLLKGADILAEPLPDLAALYAGCTTWQLALRETLALPFRHLYEAGFSLDLARP